MTQKNNVLNKSYITAEVTNGCSFDVEVFLIRLYQPINDQCFSSYRNQLIDLLSKSIDWFQYDGEHWSLMGSEKWFHFNTKRGSGVI